MLQRCSFNGPELKIRVEQCYFRPRTTPEWQHLFPYAWEQNKVVCHNIHHPSQVGAIHALTLCELVFCILCILAGFTEFVAACLHEEHVRDENLRLAFDRLDYDDTGKVTLDNLLEVIGHTSNERTINKEITDTEVFDALVGEEGKGVSYDLVSGGFLVHGVGGGPATRERHYAWAKHISLRWMGKF